MSTSDFGVWKLLWEYRYMVVISQCFMILWECLFKGSVIGFFFCDFHIFQRDWIDFSGKQFVGSKFHWVSFEHFITHYKKLCWFLQRDWMVFQGNSI